MLLELGANVRIASLDDPSRAHSSADFKRADLTNFGECLAVCEGMEYVFHLAGIKGSPAMAAQKPASFFVPTIVFNTNMMEAAKQSAVKKYLFTSTVGVYAPAEVFYEDDVWKTFPSQNDRFAGWAKRMGELQAEAYKIEYDWNDIHIVRPANVYGPFDNFDPHNAMVIPSLIKRAIDGEDPLVVWGDGTPVRDFIHARDVARGMLLVMERSDGRPINLGSGVGVSVGELVKIIVGNMKSPPEVIWDRSKPSGDRKRLMDISRAKVLGFEPKIPIEIGIKEVMEWYVKNKTAIGSRYNIFLRDRLISSII
jgi:GDP-L-fucose synthase